MRQYGVEVAIAQPSGCVLRDPLVADGQAPTEVGILRKGSMRPAVPTQWMPAGVEATYHQVEDASPADFDPMYKDVRLCSTQGCKAFHKRDHILCARHIGLAESAKEITAVPSPAKPATTIVWA